MISPQLAAAIEDFAEDTPECWDGDRIRTRCVEMSRLFVDRCLAYALDAETVWFEDAAELFGPQHAVVRVEGVYVDWTFRQFESSAPVPMVTRNGPGSPWKLLLERVEQ